MTHCNITLIKNAQVDDYDVGEYNTHNNHNDVGMITYTNPNGYW